MKKLYYKILKRYRELIETAHISCAYWSIYSQRTACVKFDTCGWVHKLDSKEIEYEVCPRCGFDVGKKSISTLFEETWKYSIIKGRSKSTHTELRHRGIEN